LLIIIESLESLRFLRRADLLTGNKYADKDCGEKQRRQKDYDAHPRLNAHTFRDQPDDGRCQNTADAAREIHCRAAEVIAADSGAAQRKRRRINRRHEQTDADNARNHHTRRAAGEHDQEAGKEAEPVHKQQPAHRDFAAERRPRQPPQAGSTPRRASSASTCPSWTS